ncbi:MAG TPA: NUDIX hydrolase [Jiangellales bacterium]|nr:NUDIX hydrolase [Jiangellales bacterium]
MSLHADAVGVLEAWAAPDAGQEALRASFLAHLRAHPDGHLRTCRPAHVTASALVVDPGSGRVLLTLHPKAGLWLQTGGHCEPGDRSLAGAALREATEESGIAGLVLGDGPVRLDRHPAPCAPGVVEQHLDVQYLAWSPTGAREQVSAESRELGWFAPDALPEPTDDAVRALVRAAGRHRVHL